MPDCTVVVHMQVMCTAIICDSLDEIVAIGQSLHLMLLKLSAVHTPSPNKFQHSALENKSICVVHDELPQMRHLIKQVYINEQCRSVN